MSKQSIPWLPMLLLGAGLWLASGGKLPSFVPDAVGPTKPEPAALADQFVAAFAKSDDRAQAKEHAHAFATICDSFAGMVDYDRKQAKPRLTLGVQLDDARLALRESRMGGFSFASSYPELRSTLDEFLTAKVGTQGGRLTPEQVAAWIDAYKTLAACAEYAAKKG